MKKNCLVVFSTRIKARKWSRIIKRKEGTLKKDRELAIKQIKRIVQLIFCWAHRFDPQCLLQKHSSLVLVGLWLILIWSRFYEIRLILHENLSIRSQKGEGSSVCKSWLRWTWKEAKVESPLRILPPLPPRLRPLLSRENPSRRPSLSSNLLLHNRRRRWSRSVVEGSFMNFQ